MLINVVTKVEILLIGTKQNEIKVVSVSGTQYIESMPYKTRVQANHFSTGIFMVIFTQFKVLDQEMKTSVHKYTCEERVYVIGVFTL